MPPVRVASTTAITTPTMHPSASPDVSNTNGRKLVPAASSKTGLASSSSPPLANTYQPQDSTGDESPNATMNVEGSRGNEPTKQQKACIHCRKSKVKCVNEGGPPCRRCLDANLECKFRLRADDENWRERTDDTLSKLSDAVDALLHRGVQQHNPPLPPSAYHHHHHHHPYAHPSHPHSMPPPHAPHTRGPGGASNGANAPQTAAFSPNGSHFSAYSHAPMHFKSSPHSEHSAHMDFIARSSPHHPPPLPRTASGPPAMLISPNGATDRSQDHWAQHHRRTSSMRSQQDLLTPNMPAPAAPSSPSGIPGPYTPNGGSKHSSNSSGSGYTPQAIPPHHHHHPVGYNHTAAAGFLRHVTSDSTPFFLTNPLPMRWTSGVPANQSYGAPVPYIGRDDPRLTCISRSLVPLEKVRSLFIYFSDKMQPHSFGFPTFPPSEYMTPLIISAISMASSLHEPSSRHHHAILKADVKAALPDDELYESRDLDPELGIGVEEITAVCIASSWLGGEEAYRLARLARWWALAYLKQFDSDSQGTTDSDGTGRSVTLGEALTILPPFRQIDLASKLRIWLEAYIVDAHQAFMHDKTPMAPHASPSYYCEALRTTMLSGSVTGNPLVSSGSNSVHPLISPASGSKLSLHDRQLIGHASLLEILLDAQRVERLHVQLQERQQQRSSQWSGESMRAQEELLARRLADLLSQVDAVDRWRERIRQDEDLSAANPASMDLTFTYLLTRSYIASLAISLDLSFMASAAPAMMPFQPAGLFTDLSRAGPSASTAEQDWPHSIMCQQTILINTAKESALSAIDLACERKGRGFGDRLVAMPTWYHFNLSHVVGFLLQLVQRKHKFLLSREARTILSKVETFVQQYVFEITSHGYVSSEMLAAHAASSHARASANHHPGNGVSPGDHHMDTEPNSSPVGVGATSPSALSSGTSGHGIGGARGSAPSATPTSGAHPHGETNNGHPTSNNTYFQTPHGGNHPPPPSSLVPKNIIPGADHPAKVMAECMAKSVAHVKAQSKG